ncbi:MAG: nucleotidyltransferase domain-containing protein [Lachnospiraceae bacterium]|nr:nucleotidyltransferase domain-containing protein [Lachnospiraceae bacterium]
MKSLYIISKKLCDIYDNKVEKIVLYGSYARCEETSDSDVDIAIILKEGHTEQMHDKMIDLIVDYELDLGVTLSVVPIEYDNYVEWENTLPFYRNIEKEGIVLWKTA